jgi:hypothetical protein
MYIVKHLRTCEYLSNDDAWTASQKYAKRFVSRDEALAECSNPSDDGHRVLKLVPSKTASTYVVKSGLGAYMNTSENKWYWVSTQHEATRFASYATAFAAARPHREGAASGYVLKLVPKAPAAAENSVPEPVKGFSFEVLHRDGWRQARVTVVDAEGVDWVRNDGSRHAQDLRAWFDMWKRGDARQAKTTHWAVTCAPEYDPASALNDIPLRCPEVERSCAKEWMRTAAQHLRNEEYLTKDRDAWKERAEKLWQMLDHIDTQDDACREFDSAFRARARKYVKRRFEILVSDGYTLRVPEQKAST